LANSSLQPRKINGNILGLNDEWLLQDEEAFQSGMEESGDDENTLDEQEKHEKTGQHKQELDDLKNEGKHFLNCTTLKYL
jgi:hypothetical protein